MIVSVFVHQIDAEAHPSTPQGWRWAVHLGANPRDMRTCLNAGWCPAQQVAAIEGEAVGVAVTKALRFAGHPCDYTTRTLEYDPTPPEASGLDLVSVM
jgi:hypothetical protein